MLDKARVYERLQRHPLPSGWEPTLKEQHHIGFLQGCVELAPIPAVSERWLANMVKVGPARRARARQMAVALAGGHRAPPTSSSTVLHTC